MKNNKNAKESDALAVFFIILLITALFSVTVFIALLNNPNKEIVANNIITLAIMAVIAVFSVFGDIFIGVYASIKKYDLIYHIWEVIRRSHG